MQWWRRLTQPVSEPVLAPQEDPGDSPAALLALVEHTESFVNRSSGRLPTGVVVDVRSLTDIARDLVATTEVRPLEVHALVSLRGVMEDYLPTTLQRFLAVDPDLAHAPHGGGPSPAEQLAEQVSYLHGSLSATAAALRRQDVVELTTQGRFLRTKFTRSDLDL